MGLGLSLGLGLELGLGLGLGLERCIRRTARQLQARIAQLATKPARQRGVEVSAAQVRVARGGEDLARACVRAA